MSAPTTVIQFPERWLHRYAVLVVFCTLGLIGLGGLVTSKGVGMAVPDWPTTYGYNMFFFPVHLWQGGVFHEHVHRLVASGIGFLSIGLAVWTQLVERRTWLKKLAWAALLLVVVQGVLGGKRVVLNDVPVLGIPGSVFFGVLHAATAQVFFCLIGTIALVTSPWWRRGASMPVIRGAAAIPGLTALILVQLLVAASMRHQHAGLAIPDFPLAHGHLYPPTNPEFIAALNQRRVEVLAFAPITAFQIHLQMLHRLLALIIVVGVWIHGYKSLGWGTVAARWGMAWSGLLLLQFTLGAATIWTDKAADLATAHVVGGALSLLTGVLFSLVLQRAKVKGIEDNSCPQPRRFLNPLPVATGADVASWRPSR